MHRKRPQYSVLGVLLVLLLSTIAGCNWAMLGSNAASFALGIITASQFAKTTTEYRCFRNGVEINCGDVVLPGAP